MVIFTKMRSLLILAALTFTLALVVIPGNVAFAEPPPFGILLDDLWAIENEFDMLAYSFSPVPEYRADDTYAPELILTPGTRFEYFYSYDVTISTITEWGAGEYTIALPAVYSKRGDGSYTFNTPGMYVISFHDGDVYYSGREVEVVG